MGPDPRKLPASVTGPAVASLVPPGQCQFGEKPIYVRLKERYPISSTSSVLRFTLPDPNKPLNLTTCACILAHHKKEDESVTRDYTPISTNADVGYFDLMIKTYGPGAKMSRHMHEILPGEKVAFKHIDTNVKIQAPFEYDHIGMLVGGTGISQMIQALHIILGSKPENATSTQSKVTMIYSSRTSDDILGDMLLHKWAEDYKDRFTLIHVLSHEPDDSGWEGKRGNIDKELVKEFMPAPTEPNIKILVCGPYEMLEALSGPPENEDELTGVLADLGYAPEQVYKF